MPGLHGEWDAPVNAYEEFFMERFYRGTHGWEPVEHRALIPGRHSGPEWDAYIGSDHYRARDRWTRGHAWAVPTDDVVSAIAAMSPIVEMGAGTGYWAHLLREAGADVTAYDQRPVLGNGWCRGAHFPVARGVPLSLRARDQRCQPLYRDHTLLLVWPPMCDLLSRTLREFPGSRCVVVGEGPGGCTGDDLGHQMLGRETYGYQYDDEGERIEPDVAPAEWRSVAEREIPQWPGMHDYVEVFERC